MQITKITEALLMKKVLVTIPHGNVKDTFMPEHVCRYLERFFDVDYNETSAQYTTEELKNLLPGYDAVTPAGARGRFPATRRATV